MTVKFARIDGVELVKTGTWEAATGRCTFTQSDLASAVESFRNRLVDRPPIKLGHDDENAFNAALSDGTPAFGWIENLRATDDGNTLVGDLVGIPEKLAEVIPAAFRSRSVELSFGYVDSTGTEHQCVLTALALLGAMPPAVKGLDDLLALYSAKPRPGVVRIQFREADTTQIPPVTFETPQSAGDTGRPADTKGTSRMKLTKEQLAGFGLAEDATPEQVKEALEAAGLAVIDPDAPTGKHAAGDKTDKVDPPVVTAPPAPVVQTPEEQAAAAAAATELATLRAQAAAGHAASVELAGIRRDGIMERAIRAGKFSVAPEGEKMRVTFRSLLDADEKRGQEMIDALPVLYPVTGPVGHALSAGPAPTKEQIQAEFNSDLIALGIPVPATQES